MTKDLKQRRAVLVVDDNEQIRRVMTRRLGPLFDEVLTTGDPQEATRILEQKQITHLLCDFDLGLEVGPPDVTGFAFRVALGDPESFRPVRPKKANNFTFGAD